MPQNKASLVYSSESGSVCPECEQPLGACSCNPSANPKDGLKTVRVSLSSKGRKGKSVTLIKGLRMKPKKSVIIKKLWKSLFKNKMVKIHHSMSLKKIALLLKVNVLELPRFDSSQKADR